MIFMIVISILEMFCIFPLFLYHVLSKKATEKGLRHFSFSDVFRTSWDIGACLQFRRFNGASYKYTSMDGKTRVSKRAPQSQPFLGNASSFLKSFYKNPVRWYVYIHFLIFVFFYSQYIFCQSACGRRKHDEKKTKRKSKKGTNPS